MSISLEYLCFHFILKIIWITRGLPSCARTVPIPVPEASNSTTKVLLKLGEVKSGVVHMPALNLRNHVLLSMSNGIHSS
jgi:hypothetical protein